MFFDLPCLRVIHSLVSLKLAELRKMSVNSIGCSSLGLSIGDVIPEIYTANARNSKLYLHLDETLNRNFLEIWSAQGKSVDLA